MSGMPKDVNSPIIRSASARGSPCDRIMSRTEGNGPVFLSCGGGDGDIEIGLEALLTGR